MWRASGRPTTVTDGSFGPTLEDTFAETLARVGVTPPFALAVSGGGDSAALTHMTARWARAKGHDPKSISVLTVDHGLRAEARAEAETVARWARALGFRHWTLAWDGPKPVTGIQQRARDARRELLCRWCRDHGVRDLLLAHTSDDQVETVGMRLLRDSGIAGLGGMAPVSTGPFGIRLCRPLLGQTGRELRSWLETHGKHWIDDPSNEDMAFERVRIRKALSGATGLAERLADVATRARQGRTPLEEAADDLLRDGMTLYPAGWARLDLSVLRSAPETVGQRALGRALAVLGGAPHPPRRASLQRLHQRLSARAPQGGTLSGCLVAPESQNSALLGREARNISPMALTARQWQLWDHRFEVWSPMTATVHPLAAIGLDSFAGSDRDRVKTAVPAALRGSLVALTFADGTFAVPHAGVGPRRGLEVVFRGLRPFGALRAAGAAR